MNYPKPVMKKSELEKMGFPDEFLLYAYRRRGQTYAWKVNPTKKNSPIVFDTESFEKWRVQMASGKAGAM